MKKIESFKIDHDKLMPGLYTSRVDGDITTYDIRLIKPNTPPFLEVPAIHTTEHLFATFARNGAFAEKIIYFGPMGCRTGFYLLVRGMEEKDVISMTKDIFKKISLFNDEIPGNTAAECGNYLEHDLPKAKEYAQMYCSILKNVKNTNYQI